MAVGDFDYNELTQSQPVMGPMMFWVYIFLVFFVLMSMFIAVIGEAFEDAKDQQAKIKHHLVGIAKAQPIVCAICAKRMLPLGTLRVSLS
jgi:hypothetical protein